MLNLPELLSTGQTSDFLKEIPKINLPLLPNTDLDIALDSESEPK
jgi:hypothetical protein